MSEGVLDQAHLVILPKSLLAGVRAARRGNHADDVFFDFFSASKFSSQNPAQGLPKGLPRDPLSHPKSDFFLNKSSPDPSSCPFFDGSLFFSLFSSIFEHFFKKKR